MISSNRASHYRPARPSSTPTPGPLRTTWFLRSILILAAVGAMFSPAFGQWEEFQAQSVDSKNVSAADAAVFDGLRAVERTLALAMFQYPSAESDAERGKIERDARQALLVLQGLYEDCLQRPVVIAPDAKPTIAERIAALQSGEPLSESDVQEPIPGRIFVSAARHIRRLFDGLPDWVGAIYQAEFDRTALSSFGRALINRDLDDVRAVALRYPRAGSAASCLVAASDLHFAAGLPREAADLLDQVTPTALERSPLLTAEDLPGLSDVVFRRYGSADVARRQIHVAKQLQDHARFTQYAAALQTLGTPTEVEPPSRARASAEQLPAFNATRAQIAWKTASFDRKVFRFRDYGPAVRVPYASPPIVADRDLQWFAVNTPTRLYRFGWDGRAQQSRELSQAQVKLRYSGTQPFREFDPLVRISPAIATIPGTDELALIGTYVSAATADEQYSGYQITASVPHRSLIAVEARRAGRVLWDTASAEVKRRDPFLASLSFNTKPVAVDGRLYALGWQKVGTINAVLVCLDVATGRALWKSILVGNQIDLTMFGEISHEPFLGGVVVHEGVVYASTNLGVLAAVRAYDGDFLWVGAYDSIRPKPHRRFMSDFRRDGVWERNPMIIFEDRLIVTPLDSQDALSVELKTGRTLQAVSYRKLGRFMVGLHGPHLVFCDRDTVVRVVARDLHRRFGDDLRLDGFLEARPALVQNGLLYATDEGLYCRRFGDVSGSRELATFSPGRTRSEEFILSGEVVVVGDCPPGSGETKILVANSDKIRCFEKVPSPAERGR